MTLPDLARSIEDKKAQLDRLRPLSTAALAQLQTYYDVELTYTSNAIEGNTLTHRETAEVIQHGITVGGKSLRDHLEAVDHYDALLWMRDVASRAVPVDEDIVRELHRRIVARSEPGIAGIYSTLPRRIAGDLSQSREDPGIDEGFWGLADQCAAEAGDRVRGTFPPDGHPSIQRRQRTDGAALDEHALVGSRLRTWIATPPRRLAMTGGKCQT